MTTMTKTRASKGGEQGINGEWYDGGQFLPSSATTVKGESGKYRETGNAIDRND